MIIEPNIISYRDTAARVVKKESGYYRYIFHEYKAEYEHLMQSGLYQDLTQKGLLIQHKEIEKDTDDPNVYKLLYPTQIPFQSYPFEWSFLQWKKAITAYLHINKIALKYGMVLKDATPYNFYLSGGKSVMFDTSSFTFFKKGDNWLAYRQFCSEFLSPITLMYYNGQRWSRITRTHLRGLPLDFVSKQLPIKSWFNLNTFLHIHFHSKYANENKIKGNKKRGGFSVEKINTLIEMMLDNLKYWTTPYQFEKKWHEYYSKDIESEEYLEHKEELINNWLGQIKPTSVLDLGANTGKFSMLAAKYAEKVIAIESDDKCIDIIEKQIKSKYEKGVSAILLDIAEPTPNLGALNLEINSIFKRAKSQIVMALAIVHHLNITNQLKFFQIAELLSMFSNEYLIIEFIPINDNKVQLLLKDKTINMMDYNEDKFTKELSKYFALIERRTLNKSKRILLLFKKNNTILS
jgi:SAM-dependent methyltransferase